MRPLDWATAAATLPAAGSFLATSAEQAAGNFSDWLAQLAPTETASGQSEQKLDVDDFRSEVTDFLRRSGIDLNRPVEISFNRRRGEFEVRGDHPQRIQIEALLNGEKSLVEQADKLTALDAPEAEVHFASSSWQEEFWTFRVGSSFQI